MPLPQPRVRAIHFRIQPRRLAHRVENIARLEDVVPHARQRARPDYGGRCAREYVQAERLEESRVEVRRGLFEVDGVDGVVGPQGVTLSADGLEEGGCLDQVGEEPAEGLGGVGQESDHHHCEVEGKGWASG